ncbi:MAG: manganese efflux pump MntP family protein [Lachnospiraceae bacterium]|nr:manganese efflux pump MntP family protein [Lachnospiraceae bacterium]
MEYVFFAVNSILLGVGLAMDAFSVCIANGLNETGMIRSRRFKIAGVFGGFQAAMPMIGWFCVRALTEWFAGFHKLVPWIALVLLVFIGVKMIRDGLKGDETSGEEIKVTSGPQLFIQGIATSIDALSVGFTISDNNAGMAAGSALIIGVVTFVICLIGLSIGQKVGKRLSKRAPIVGGIILIVIGLEIFISHTI